MLKINDGIFIDERNLSFQFIRSSGPGGQNVNKVSTAVELRFDIMNDSLISPYIKKRVYTIAGHRISKEGILVISSDIHRTQHKNKEEAMERFVDLLKKAAVRPKKRIKTKPSRTSKEKRISSKKKTAANKKLRSKKGFAE